MTVEPFVFAVATKGAFSMTDHSPALWSADAAERASVLTLMRQSALESACAIAGWTTF